MNEGIAKKMLAIAALAMLLPTAAWAISPGDRGQRSSYEGKAGRYDCFRGGGERHLGRMADVLQLTDTQREQVRAIMAAQREQAAPLAAQMHQERQALRTAIHSGAVQEEEIRAQVTAQAENKAEMMVLRAAAWKEIYALLTPEQQILAAEEFATRGYGGMGKKGRGYKDGGRR